MYYIWMTQVAPLVSPLTTMAILLATIPVWVTYIRTWRSDPGIIAIPQNEKFSTLINIFERTENKEDELDPGKFCWTCLMRKPLRSKHCSVCDQCVATFD